MALTAAARHASDSEDGIHRFKTFLLQGRFCYSNLSEIFTWNIFGGSKLKQPSKQRGGGRGATECRCEKRKPRSRRTDKRNHQDMELPCGGTQRQK
jgi:hypothetical protein